MPSAFCRRRPGFTLVEVLVAVVVLAVGIAAGVRTMGAMAQASTEAADRASAVRIASQRLALLEAASGLSIDAASNSNLQPTALQTDTSGVADLTDADGQDVIDPRFHWQQQLSPAEAVTGLLQVTVTVTWNSGPVQRHYVVTTYLPDPNAQTTTSTTTPAPGG